MPFQPAPQPCWLVLVEGDWRGCGDCRGQAEAVAELVRLDEIADGAVYGDSPPVVVYSGGLCVVVACAGCGELWRDPESGAVVHCASMVEALAGVLDEGWAGDVCPACRAADAMP
ncbi:hypothetical protein [Micromonospora tulbaghiae]|uniref:hypothetical protein n=1 Tax=Micromonospora tulbaghiae TaxID=479978 RepID=UPI0033E76CEE